MTTDYTELNPAALVTIGVAQLGEAQGAYDAMLRGNAWSPAVTGETTVSLGPLRGDAAKAHATWLLESAHAHFRAALALDMVTGGDIEYDDDPGEWEDDADTEDPGVTGDDPPTN